MEQSASVRTIQKVNQILETIGISTRGARVSDIASKTGLPKATVHRLLSTLLKIGYVRQDQETKVYYLGLKLLELGTLAASQINLRKISEPLLRDLANRTKETVHMVVYEQGEVVYIEKIESEQGLGGLKMASRVGARNPAHSCAVGKVLLSFMSEEELTEFVKTKGLPKRTDNTITDETEFLNHINKVRELGYAIDDEENEQGIRCVAAPILDGKGKAVAAISISGPSFRVTRELIDSKLKNEVIMTAREISKKIGFGTIEK
ncbi:MAG: IclR family transcriptional regulator [Deltaproteobacteria bacterium]|nr:IclR family transcriptional regulator [Deltaproteobacteria bacterium]